jgi:hypothetical protein
LYPAYKLYILHVILIGLRKTTPVADAGEITTMSNAIPQDSVLRRHFEQMQTRHGVSSGPQDSILARHHAQLMAAAGAAPAQPAPPAKSPPPAPAAAAVSAPPRPVSAPVSPAAAQPQKGFFGRILDMLFGRS